MVSVTILIIALTLFYRYLIRTYKYWEKKGIKHDKPLLFFGTNKSAYLMQKSMSQVAEETYWKYPNEKVVGFYRSTQPELLIRDPELVKRILSTDFAYFYPRGLNTQKKVIEPLMRNLFFADGDLWRLLRQRMTPAFSSGKLKAMFPLIVERAEKLQARALAAVGTDQAIDARDLMARYTTDIIGACGFGLDANSLSNEDSEFRKLGAAIFKVTFKEFIVITMKEIFPELFKHMKYMGKIEKDMINVVKTILQQRSYRPSGRNDFIDLLLECKNKGIIIGQSLEKIKSDGTPDVASLELTDELIAAQVFVLFAAGFETSSSATSFTLHQLAFHPEVQQKVQAEIDRVLAKYNNKLCYDAIREMTYLDWTFNEGMRMFPSLGFLTRECARPYTFPGINLTIDEGVRLVISLQALHNDPKYFEDPEVFRPERFNPAEFDVNKTDRVYLPFGDGPRACIGVRMARMLSLAGLAAVLSKCSVKPAAETIKHPVVDPKSSIVQVFKDGLPLRFCERNMVSVS